MRIEDILPDSLRVTALNAANIAIEKPALIAEIIKLAFADKGMISTRAANTIEKIDVLDQSLIQPHYKKIIGNLTKFKTEGVKRCLLKIFTKRIASLTEKEMSLLLDFCFKALLDNAEAIAIRIYSIDILYSISKKEPGLKNELILVLQEQIAISNSLAFQSKARKILNLLYSKSL